MKKIFIVLTLLLSLTGCNDEVKEPTPVPTKVETKPSVDLRKEIYKIVKESPDCSNYYWKNRGRAKSAYIDGMALMYAKQVCGKGSDFIKPNKITGRNSIQAHKDALAYYRISGNELNTYTFLIGLGMRESSGKYCSGRDRSQNFTHARSAEAGIFQTAYVARVFNKEMKPVYEAYKAGKLNCELPVFKSSDMKCTTYDAKTFGTGEGATWQKLTKKCPAFSTQWAAILIRSNYRHFGPIIRKDVEFRTQCRDMLYKVEKIAKQNCEQL